MKYEEILSKMTLEQKIALCSGKSFWSTKDFAELGIPSISLNDGPHGPRKQNQKSDHLGINSSVPATCFPTASALACSWDEALAREVGEALGEECLQEDTQVLLGPGVNIKRNPLCGRNFEYYSEDPYLAGKMAAGWIRGVQSKGVSASLKHFACNNAENHRMVSDSIVDARALHEIYLKPFEIAVKEGKPGTVMCAYNRINGTYCSDNQALLTGMLRDEWGFDGAVMTDWGAMNDRVRAFEAGLDLEMPNSRGHFDQEVLAAVRAGKLSEEAIDRSVLRLLKLIFETHEACRTGYHYDAKAHHALAHRAAAQSAMLLKNERGLLPLKPGCRIALVGALAETPRYQGAGSSRIQPTKLDSIVDGFRQAELDFQYYEGYSLEDGTDESRIAEAAAGARKSEVVVAVIGLTDAYESEGLDRESMELPPSHCRLVEQLAAANSNLVVLLVGGSPVAMPWAEKAKAVLNLYLSGQAGGLAAADLLTGKANPCGKLVETYPVQYQDAASAELFSQTPTQQVYAESLYVGYRYYDTAQVQPQYPFGYGLSYTTFQYNHLQLDTDSADGTVTVSCSVRNTGKRDGAEIVQLYVRAGDKSYYHPLQELKGFQKVELACGEEKTVTFRLEDSAFAHYDAVQKAWVTEAGAYEILVAASSRDVRLHGTVQRTGSKLAQKDQVPAWYFCPVGKPTPANFEALLGHPIPQPVSWEPGHYTMECSVYDLRDSLVGKQMLASMEQQIALGFGGKADYGNPQFKMVMETSAGTPFKNMSLLSGEQMSAEQLSGLLALANAGLPLPQQPQNG